MDCSLCPEDDKNDIIYRFICESCWERLERHTANLEAELAEANKFLTLAGIPEAQAAHNKQVAELQAKIDQLQSDYALLELAKYWNEQ